MNVSYTMPLQQSWARMVRMLFRPFRIETWLTVGFAAFLSEYLSHFGGGKSFHGRVQGPFREAARSVATFLLHPVWGPLVIAVTVAAVIAGLVFMWVCSRGKFVFLDDVVHERPAIVDPWKRYAHQGNGLFVFWLAMTLVSITLFIAISIPLIPAILGTIAAGGMWPVLSVVAVGWWVAAMIPLGLIVAYAHLFLFQFVVPIMYRDQIGVLAAWQRFFALFRVNVLSFIAFGLFYLILMIAMVTVILAVGFSTCCMGFLLLWLPYVGSVLMLPLEITLRGLGPDFLAQFGSEWALTQPVTPAPAPGPAA